MGVGVKFPLVPDTKEGFYQMTPTLKAAIQQNFLNLLLTSPGEKPMDNVFGVGIKHYLFEQNIPIVHEEIKTRISEQVDLYMPFLGIKNISIQDVDDITADHHMINLVIEYFIGPVGEPDILNMDITESGFVFNSGDYVIGGTGVGSQVPAGYYDTVSSTENFLDGL